MIHQLKTLREFWDAVADGSKTFEVRRDDRGFKVGDQLNLVRWYEDENRSCPVDPQTDQCPVGQIHDSDIQRATLSVVVTYKLPGGRFGLDASYCVLGIRRLE